MFLNWSVGSFFMDTSEARTFDRDNPALLAPGDWWISHQNGVTIELVEISIDCETWRSATVTPTSPMYVIPGGCYVRAVNDLTLSYTQKSPDSVIYYTNRTRLDQMFGRQNIAKWADLENDGLETTLIDARITTAILDIQELIDSHLCHLYLTPFDPAPRVIQSIATALAGHELRDARHMDEDDASVLRKYEIAMKKLMLIKEGAIRLPDLQASTMGSIEAFV